MRPARPCFESHAACASVWVRDPCCKYSTEKLSKTLPHKKTAHKMLVKLTPWGGDVPKLFDFSRTVASRSSERANGWSLFSESRTYVSNFRSDFRRAAFLTGSLLTLVVMSHSRVEWGAVWGQFWHSFLMVDCSKKLDSFSKHLICKTVKLFRYCHQ